MACLPLSGDIVDAYRVTVQECAFHEHVSHAAERLVEAWHQHPWSMLGYGFFLLTFTASALHFAWIWECLLYAS